LKRKRFLGYLTTLLVGFLCLPGHVLGGVVNGRVVFVGAPPAPKKLEVTIDQFLCGTEKDAEDLLLSPRKEIRNAVVWLENPPPTAAWPART
jgi:hypothetical protein